MTVWRNTLRMRSTAYTSSGAARAGTWLVALGLLLGLLTADAARAASSFQIGTGRSPQVTVDDAGTARAVWVTIPPPGDPLTNPDVRDPIHYCVIPRGARACANGDVVLGPPGSGTDSLAIFQAGATIHIVASRLAPFRTFVNSFPATGSPSATWAEIGTLEFGTGGAVLGPGNHIFGMASRTVQAYPIGGPLVEQTAPLAQTFSFPLYSAIGLDGTTPVAVSADGENMESFRYVGAGTTTLDYNTAANWSGPTAVTPAGAEVRLAGGPKGLVLLTSARLPSNEVGFQAHLWNGTSFGPAVNVGQPETGYGYDLFQQPTTGMLYAAWRRNSAGDPLARLRLALSGNGGATWNAASDIVSESDGNHISDIEVAAAPDLQGLAVYAGAPAGPNNSVIRATSLEALPGQGPVAAPPPAPTPPALVAIADLRVTPSAFRAARSGAPVLAAVAKTGGRVSYSLNVAGSVRFTVQRSSRGRRSGARCVKPTRSNRRRASCTRFVSVAGSFVRGRPAGADRFTFTGRLAGRALRPGSYRLVAIPTAGGRTGVAARARLRIVR